MKKIALLILFILFHLSTESQVPRIAFGEMIFDQLYSSNSNPDVYDAVNFPNPFLDVDDSSDSGKKIKILSYLEYKTDAETPFNRYSNFHPYLDMSRGDAIRAVVQAWDFPSVFYTTSPFNDVSPGDLYYGEFCAAYDYGMISGGTLNPYASINSNEANYYMNWIMNSRFEPVSSNTLSNLDNYFVPNNYQPNNIGFLRGIEHGVFSHYAKNSFVIPDRKFNLNFSHYYSTQMVELPQSYFPIQPLGRGWTHTYNTYIVRENNVGANEIDYYYIKWADGSIDIYNEDDEEYLTKGVYDELEENTNDFDIVITKKNQIKYYFNIWGVSGPDEPIYYLEKIEDSNGNTVLLSYEDSDVDDKFARLKKVTAPSGKTLNFYYHNNTDLIDYIEDPIDRQIKFTYNEERLKYFYDAKNQETRYYYVSNDEDAPDEHQYKRFLLRRVKLPRGNNIRAEYDDDDNGKLESYRINDTETKIKVDYSDYEAITSRIEVPMPNGGTQNFDYKFNIKGMVTDFQNDNQDITIKYPNPTDDNPLLPTNIDINGLDVYYDYDDKGNVISKKIENNEDEDFWYDDNNNLIQYQDENGKVTFFNYDTNNNLISIIDALSNSINFTYDSFGQVLSVKNQEGITVNYSYENDGAVSTITGPENLTSSFSYDGINRLLSQTINGQTSSFIYDPNDNLTSHTNIGGLTTTFNYDENDNLITITNAKGVNTSFTYNNEDQVTSETFGSLVKKYEYNDDGTLDKYIKPSGLEIEYSYLSDGKLNNAGTIADIDHFDANDGKKEGLIKSIASNEIRYNFDYDFLNRLDEVDIEDEPDLGIDYDYDAVGNITKISYPRGNNNERIEVIYGYDAKNRMLGFGTGRQVNYTYRDDDLISSVNYGNIVIGTFTYDDAGRKTGVTYRYGGASNEIIFSESVVLDERGNIVSENRYYANQETGSHSYIPPTQNYTYNENNHLQQAGDNSFVFNQDGNMNFRTTPKGIPGVNDVGEAHLTYNIDDQLISITGSNIPNYNKTYKYDAYGNRTKRTYSNGSSTSYVWDIINNNVIFEQYDSNSGLEDRSLIYGALGLEMSVFGNNWNASLIYLGDLRGSVVATVTQPTSSHPSEYSFNKYDDFGNLVSGAYDPYTDNFKYLGKYGIILEDVHTGHYYIKARHYDALTGRFFTQDPIWSTNLYPYSENNPISRVDFNGMESYNFDSCSANASSDKSLLFDGSFLNVYNSEGTQINRISATSGKDYFMNNPNFQNLENLGPIPEGNYTIGNNWNKQSLPRQYFNIFRGNGDWGDYNIAIEPNFYSTRDSFYLHGGFFPGSAGCIDVGGNSKFLYELLKNQKKISLDVKY